MPHLHALMPHSMVSSLAGQVFQPTSYIYVLSVATTFTDGQIKGAQDRLCDQVEVENEALHDVRNH